MSATPRRVRHFIVATIAALVAVNTAVFATRAGSLLAVYRWFIAEGAEGPNPYAIWRVMHGHPLYEWPLTPPYTLTLYNFAYYHAYAAVLEIFGVDGERILLGARFVTLSLALVGCWCFYRLTLEVVGESALSKAVRLSLAGMSAIVWFGTNFAAWWPLCIRPDAGAWLFATCGLWFSVMWLRRRSSLLLIASSSFFALAWAFKQPTVWLFAGCLVYTAVFVRRARPLLALLGPFAVLVALSLSLGSPAYRYNLLAAPTLSRWHAGPMLDLLLRLGAANLFVWLFWLAAVLAEWRANQKMSRKDALRGLTPVTTLLLTCLGISLLTGAASLGREGTSKNQLMEAYLVAALLSVAGLVRTVLDARTTTPRVPGLLAAALLTSMLGLPLAQLVWPNRYGIQKIPASDAQLQARQRLARAIATLPKPLFIADDIFSQPWHSSGGHYPAVALDYVWFDIATRAGAVGENALQLLPRTHGLRSVIRPAGDPWLAQLASSGFTCAPLAEVADQVACTAR
jgi:hypothetical protein